MTKKVVEAPISGQMLQRVADMVGDEYKKRKDARCDLEKKWAEVDRQVAMTAQPSNIDKKSGRAAPGSEWMPFIELPWQAQTLELLTSDDRRLTFPDSRKWFSAIAHDSDETIMKMERRLSEQGFVGSVNSEAVNAIVEACHLHFESLYDFRGEVDKLKLSAYKYGTLVGRMRGNLIRTSSPDYRTTATSGIRAPVLTAFPLMNTYLDDTPAAAQRAGVNVSPAEIFTWHQRWEDLVIAARRGSTDPDEENGGWLPGMLKDLSPDPKTQQVHLAEWEGDLLFDVGADETRFVKKAIVTVVFANKDDKAVSRVIRFRKTALPSYIAYPYHQDDTSTRYGSSPLLKGCPIQLAASEMFSRMVQAGILNVEPMISWRPTSVFMSANRGPVIAPRELWEDPGNSIKVHQVGDPNALLNAWLALKNEYESVTGTTAPRLGQQTKSHQTAFAVDTELQRSGVRTVDFVRSFQDHPARTLLHLEYVYIKKALRRPTPIYIPKFKQWLEISGDMLPDIVTYDIKGAATPLEEREKAMQKQQARNEVVGLAQAAVAVQEPNPVDFTAMIKEVAEDGGLDEALLRQPEGGAFAPAVQPGVQGADPGTAGDQFIRLAAGTAAPPR